MTKRYWKILGAALCAFALGGSASAQTIVDEARLAKTVWSGYWWPTAKQEILKPLAKYDYLTGANSVAWEKQNNPASINGRSVPGWTGLCHGWAAAALLEEETTRPRNAQQNDRRSRLSVGDQKAWLSLAHGGDVANFYGRRYDGEGDSFEDMAPEVLWEALQATIRDQKIGLVIDLEPGAQVWNFPAYAYRVQCAKKQGNVYQGKFYIWFASDQVAPDFVGVKTILQAYPFEIELTDDGTPIFGSGRWVGAAKKSHPDFAWVPYLVRSGNDQLSYETVCRLLSRTPVTPNAPEVAPNEEVAPTEDVAANEETAPNEEVAPTEDVAANEETAPNEEVAANEETENAETTNVVERQPSIVAPNDLEELLYAAKTLGNRFVLDARVSGLRRQIKLGEELTIEGISKARGYLHLVAVDANNEIALLYPQPGDDNFVEADKPFVVPNPNAPYAFVASKPLGACRVYAIVSERPLPLASGRKLEPKADGSKTSLPLDSLTTWRAPSDKGVPESVEKDSNDEKADVVRRCADALGYFSCDETMFQVVEEPPKPRAVKEKTEDAQQSKPNAFRANVVGDVK